MQKFCRAPVTEEAWMFLKRERSGVSDRATEIIWE